jgi:hypothetical protein
MAGIDQRGMGRPGRLDPRAGGLRAAVDGDRENYEAVLLQLLIDGLPDWQVEPAPSP